jgi:hypothetical protein
LSPSSAADGAAVVTFLAIVSRTRPDLHAYVRRAFFTDPRLQVVVDRRCIVRRRTFERAATPERRRKERRDRREIDEQIQMQGWIVVPISARHHAD